jgi:hypothetical protein
MVLAETPRRRQVLPPFRVLLQKDDRCRIREGMFSRL